MKASITLSFFPMQSLLVRNGNELRRSLRRINSLTRRKLSPSNSSSASGAASARSGGGGGGSCKVRKNSKVSIKSDDGGGGGGQVQDSHDPHDSASAALAV